METHNGQLSVANIFVIAILIVVLLLISGYSCNYNVSVPTETPEAGTSEIDSLDDKIETPTGNPTDITPMSTGEEVFFARCSTCHNPEKNIDKFHGEQWEYVIGRMIKKEGAMFTPQLAEKVYEYLYNRTKLPDAPPFDEVIKGRSHFEEANSTTISSRYTKQSG